MNGLDHAFIRAYRNDGQATEEDAARVVQESGQAPGPEAKHTGGSCYRVDAGQQPGQIRAPHVSLTAGQMDRFGPPAYAVEVSTWDLAAAPPPDEALVSANLVPWSAGATAKKAAASHEKTSCAEEKTAEEKDGAPPHMVAADALPRTEHETPATGPERFKPIWEVDRFSWSSEINRLYDAESKYFGYAGVKLREASREGLRVLGIASARAGDGCTTLAICLARAASDAGVKVALLDANTDQPQLAARLGVKFSHGWQGAVAGETPLSETAIISLDNAMTLLPLSASSRDELTSLDDPRVTELVQTIATGVDLVVIDLGHVGSNSTCRFERGANCPIDAAIVVRDVRRTSEQQTLAIAGRLKECGIDAVGIAENYAPPDSTAKTAAA